MTPSTPAQALADAADINAAQAFITAHSDSTTSTGPSYTFTSSGLTGLTFSNIESLDVVPEPSALCLMTSGVVLLWGRRGRSALTGTAGRL